MPEDHKPHKEDPFMCLKDDPKWKSCCCTCLCLIRTRKACRVHQGGTGYCDHSGTDGLLGKIAAAADEGYACALFFFMDGSPILTDWVPHGICEGYQERPGGRIGWSFKNGNGESGRTDVT